MTGAVLLLLASAARAGSFEASVGFVDDTGLNMDNTSPVSASASGSAGQGSASAAASAAGLKATSTSFGSGDEYYSQADASLTTSDLVLTTLPTVTSVNAQLNLVLNGTMAAFSGEDTQGYSEIRFNVNVGDVGGGDANYVVSAGDGSINQRAGDGDITVTPTSTTANTATFSNVPVPIEVDDLPTNVPIDLDLSLDVDTHYYGDGAGGSASGSANFGDTLSFNPTQVFTDLDGDAVFTADALDVGIVANTAIAAPEPGIVLAASFGFVLLLLGGRRRSTMA